MNSSTVGLDWSGKEISTVQSLDIFRQESMGKSALNLSQCRIAIGFCGALGELLATLPVRALILRDISLRGANEEEEAACHATLLNHVCRLLALEYLDITNTKAPEGAIRALVATLGVRPNMRKVVMAASAADVNVLLRYLPSRVELGVRTTGSRDDVVTWSKVRQRASYVAFFLNA